MTDPIAAALAALRREYLAEGPARLAELRKDLAAFRAGEPDARASLRTRFHRIAGSGGSYGFPEIGAIAREAERRMADDIGPDLPAHLDAAIERLEAAFDAATGETA